MILVDGHAVIQTVVLEVPVEMSIIQMADAVHSGRIKAEMIHEAKVKIKHTSYF
jgi:hypothetical protein